MRTRLSPLVGAFLALETVVSGSWLHAQQPDQAAPSPTFRAGTDVVRLDVSVLDKSRRPVRGLTASDFTVLENGAERPIVAFTAVDLPEAPAAEAPGAAWLTEAPRDVVTNAQVDRGRMVVIAFDWSIRMDDQPLARRIAQAVVDALGPTDEATVVFTKPSGAAGRPQGFTSDHARLRAAIAQPFAAALTCPPGGKCDANSSSIVDPEGYESGDCLCGQCTLEALTRMGRTLQSVTQRPKTVFFIGTYVRTYEAMVGLKVTKPGPGEMFQTFATTAGATDCGVRLRDARVAFSRAMAAANVTVHVLDPVGLESQSNSPLGIGRSRERLDSLPVVADITGGRTVINSSTPERAVPAILDETRSYYLLGFTPAATTADGKPREIAVKVRPQGLTVKARSTFTMDAVTAAAKPTAAARLATAISAVVPSGDVPMTASVVALVAGTKAAALVVGRIDAPPPTAILAAAFSPSAQPVTSRRVTIPASVAAGRAGSPLLAVVSALALDPGLYEVRFAAESADGSAGSVHAFVEVPDFFRSPLTMSGILVHVTPEEPAVPRDEVVGVLPFAPTALRTFNRGTDVSAFVQVSQGITRKAPVEAVTLRSRVFDAHDRVVDDRTSALTVDRFQSNRTANVRFPLRIAALPAGEFLLRLSASAGTHVTEQYLRFHVE